MDSLGGREPCSAAQCSVTVREREGEGNGGTGVYDVDIVGPIAAAILPPSAELFPYPTESEGGGPERRKGAGEHRGRARNDRKESYSPSLAMSRCNYGRWAVFSCPRLITGEERQRRGEAGEMGDEGDGFSTQFAVPLKQCRPAGPGWTEGGRSPGKKVPHP